jgi:holo-[acyl-carrier protein] synthase
VKVLGIGVDLVEVSRLEQSIDRQGERFLRRVFTPNEIAYCAAMKSPGPNYAARFAAKEAIAKAFGTGLGAQLSFQDIEVRRKASGEPYVVLHGEGAKLARRRGVRQIFLSLSHTSRYAVAQVVISGSEP